MAFIYSCLLCRCKQPTNSLTERERQINLSLSATLVGFSIHYLINIHFKHFFCCPLTSGIFAQFFVKGFLHFGQIFFFFIISILFKHWDCRLISCERGACKFYVIVGLSLLKLLFNFIIIIPRIFSIGGLVNI